MGHREEDAARRHAGVLKRKVNVVGAAGGDDRVLVLVEQKVELDELADDDVVPPDVDGVPTDVIETGTLWAQRTVAAGASLGLDEPRVTGTLGGFVADEHGRRYGLTNAHVAAATNKALPLTVVRTPGPADGEGQSVGRLARAEPVRFAGVNYVDAALVELWAGVDLDPAGILDSPVTLRTGWGVAKRGRTSGYTEGEVLARGASVDVNYGADGVASFEEQVLTTPMLEPGDSGSIVTTSAGYPGALGFAGSSRVSIHSPMWLVLRTLAVTLLDAELRPGIE